jgi:hypothetical protein
MTCAVRLGIGHPDDPRPGRSKSSRGRSLRGMSLEDFAARPLRETKDLENTWALASRPGYSFVLPNTYRPGAGNIA